LVERETLILSCFASPDPAWAGADRKKAGQALSSHL